MLLDQYSDDLDMMIGFALQHPAPAVRRLALNTVLSRKSWMLDSATDALAAVRRRLGLDGQRLLDEYRRNQTLHATQLLLARTSLKSREIKRYEEELAAMAARTNELERRIAEHSKEFRDHLQPVTVAGVQAALPSDDAALVEWVRYREFAPRGALDDGGPGVERYAVSVLHDSGDPVWLDLGDAAPIDAVIDEWRRALSEQMSYQLAREAATRLDALIMAPVRAHLGSVTRLYLAPAGSLDRVVFATLIDEHGRHLTERYWLTYVLSGSDLVLK